jgi:hypothetical protein
VSALRPARRDSQNELLSSARWRRVRRWRARRQLGYDLGAAERCFVWALASPLSMALTSTRADSFANVFITYSFERHPDGVRPAVDAALCGPLRRP